MKKQTAIDLFGSRPAMAEALGCTRQAIWNWPDELKQSQVDQIVGASLRKGLMTMQSVEKLIADNAAQ